MADDSRRPVAATTRLEVAADALVLLIGPSGAGKATGAARHFQPQQVLSSDRLRAMVAGDEADQAASADAFKVLHLIARARLRRGLLTVIDATNLTRSARGSLLKLSTAATRPAVAVVFDVSLELCLRQNAARAGRQVPEPVVRRHHEQLRIAIDVLQREGYAEIATLRDADMTKP